MSYYYVLFNSLTGVVCFFVSPHLLRSTVLLAGFGHWGVLWQLAILLALQDRYRHCVDRVYPLWWFAYFQIGAITSRIRSYYRSARLNVREALLLELMFLLHPMSDCALSICRCVA